jgi:DNA polymerase gamma 1
MLGNTQSQAIWHRYNQNEYATSRFNWSIQTTGVDLKSIFKCLVEYILLKFKPGVEAKFAISIHDEYWYYVKKGHEKEFAAIMQIAHLYSWAYLCHRLGFVSMPLGYGYFSSVNVDSVLRKEVYMEVKTPSNDEVLELGYGLKVNEVL